MYFTALVDTNYKEFMLIDMQHDLQHLLKFINTDICPNFYPTKFEETLGTACLEEIQGDTRDSKLHFWIKVSLDTDKSMSDKLFDLFMEKFRIEFNDYLSKANEVSHIPNFNHHFLDTHFYTFYRGPNDDDYPLKISTTYNILYTDFDEGE